LVWARLPPKRICQNCSSPEDFINVNHGLYVYELKEEDIAGLPRVSLNDFEYFVALDSLKALSLRKEPLSDMYDEHADDKWKREYWSRFVENKFGDNEMMGKIFIEYY
jgi:hypothetical protein